MRWDPTQEEMRVGDCCFLTTVAIAHGSRSRASRFWSHLESSFRRDPRNRATSSTDRDDVNHRNLAGEPSNASLGSHRGFTSNNNAYICRSSPTVQSQNAFETCLRGNERSPQSTCRGAREHCRNGLMYHLVGREHSTVALHHIKGHDSFIDRIGI